MRERFAVSVIVSDTLLISRTMNSMVVSVDVILAMLCSRCDDVDHCLMQHGVYRELPAHAPQESSYAFLSCRTALWALSGITIERIEAAV